MRVPKPGSKSRVGYHEYEDVHEAHPANDCGRKPMIAFLIYVTPGAAAVNATYQMMIESIVPI